MCRNLTQSPRTEGKLRERAQQNSKGDTNETVKSDPSSHSLTTAHHWRFHINKPEKAQPPSCQSFFRYPTKQWDPPIPIHMHQWTALLDLWLITKEKKNSSEYPTWDISRQHHDSDDDDNKAYREAISAPCKVRHHVILTISSKNGQRALHSSSNHVPV